VTGPRELLDQLDALHAAADTREPWRTETVGGRDYTGEGWAEVRVVTADQPPMFVGDDEQAEADAALIVAAVNALPGLVAAVRTALAPHYPVAVRDRKGQHTHDVCSDSWNPWPCATYRAIAAALVPADTAGGAS
jgi:hypothetical protein